MNNIETFYSPVRVSPIFEGPHRKEKVEKSIQVYNSNQQIQLANILTWRQKTSLPVARVLGFKVESNQLQYPKTFIIELEPTKRPLKDLNQVQLPHSIYLLQQFSLGVHALCYKFANFDLQKLFFGFNQKGQCRVWLTDDILECCPKQMRLPTDQVIVTQIYKAVERVCSQQCKMKMKPILHEILAHPQLRFPKFHEILNEFGHKHCIKVPTSIQIDDLPNSLLTSTCLMNKSLTPSKINFRYQSPTPRNLTSKPITLATCSFVGTSASIKSSQTIKSQSNKMKKSPTVHFSYDKSGQSSLGNSLLGSPTCSSRSSTIHHSQNASNISKMSNLYQPTNSIVFNSRIPKSDYQLSRDYYFGASHHQGEIKTDGIYKTSSSLTFPQSVASSFSSVQQRNERFDEYIESTSTKQSENSKSQQYQDSVKPQAKQLGQQNNGKYNFGGLIPLQQETSKKNEMLIEESQSKTIELFDSRKHVTSLENHSSPVIRSIIINHSGAQQRNFEGNNSKIKEWDWGNKVNNLLMDDDQDLKQSYYCGEERTAEALPIKLQLLGKFGRNISSSNVIHDQY